MGDRQQLISEAFASYAEGDLEPLHALFDPQARWLGVPQGRLPEETPCCSDRAEIVDLLGHHYANGRRFTLGEMVEQGDRIAVEVTVANPDWSGPVTIYKVFTFRPDQDIVVRLNDCIDESYALQVLAA